MKRESGFSLIEVIIAVVLLGISIAGLTEAMAASYKSYGFDEDATHALYLARSVIEERRVVLGLVEGTTEIENGDYPRLLAKETIGTTPYEGLYTVKVEVFSAASQKRLIALETLLFELPTRSEIDPNQDASYDPSGAGR